MPPWEPLPTAFLLAVGLTMFCALAFTRIAWRIGLVDHPSGRKAHTHPTPVVGGLAMVVPLALLTLIWREHLPRMIGFETSALGLVILGFVDDRTPISARLKFALQIALCTWAVLADRVALPSLGPFWPGGSPIDLGVFGPIMTVLATLTVVNAFNMIDGVDGLCGSLALVALGTLAAAAIFGQGAPASALVLSAVCGAVVGFLALNFPWRKSGRARLFLGDAGSTLLGFCVAYFSLRLCAHGVIHYSEALWIALIPVFDAVIVFGRRSLISGRPFTAGRDHIHHLLMRTRSPRQTTLLLFAAAAIIAPTGFVLHTLYSGLGFGLDLWACVFVAYGLTTNAFWLSARRRGAAESAAAQESALPIPSPTDGVIQSQKAA